MSNIHTTIRNYYTVFQILEQPIFVFTHAIIFVLVNTALNIRERCYSLLLAPFILYLNKSL